MGRKGDDPSGATESGVALGCCLPPLARYFMPCLLYTSWGINPNNLFKAFSELIREGKLPTNCLIKIIGNNSKLDIPQNIASNVFQLDSVIHTEAIRMSLDVDTLVVIHPTGRKGVYTGKLFDYLATNKPILALCDP